MPNKPNLLIHVIHFCYICLSWDLIGVLPLRLLAPQLRSRSASVLPCPSRPLPSHGGSPRGAQTRVNRGCPSAQAEGSCYPELNPNAHGYVERLRVEEQPRTQDEDGDAYCLPVVEAASSIRPGVYVSPLMATENKPLEVGILRRAKELLAQVDPRTAAKHITKADCTVPLAALFGCRRLPTSLGEGRFVPSGHFPLVFQAARILDVTPEVEKMMGVSSGVELLTLPHGQRLRLDLLER